MISIRTVVRAHRVLNTSVISSTNLVRQSDVTFKENLVSFHFNISHFYKLGCSLSLSFNNHYGD